MNPLTADTCTCTRALMWVVGLAVVAWLGWALLDAMHLPAVFRAVVLGILLFALLAVWGMGVRP